MRPSPRFVQGSKFKVQGSRFLLVLVLVLILNSALQTVLAQATNSPSRFDYASFHIITDRNIFNPRRSARYTRTERPRQAATRTDSFALVGTMSYEKGLFAFFDGSSSDYRKVLKQDDTIAGFKVAGIEASYVKLASPTNQVELHVGMQLRHEDDGDWHVSVPPETAAPSRISSTASRPPSQASVIRSAPALAGQTDAPGAIVVEGEVPPLGPEGGPPIGVVETQQPPAAAEPAATSGGSESGVAAKTELDATLERLRQRAAAERGENP